MLNRKKMMGVLLLLSIFIFLMGTAFASETADNSSCMSNSDSNIINEQSVSGISSNDISNDFKLSNEINDELSDDSNVFENPDFEEGTLDDEGNVYGWNITKTPGGQGKYDKSRAEPIGKIVAEDPEEQADMLDGNALFIEYDDGGLYYISQYIDFTSVKSISFYYNYLFSAGDFTVSVGGETVSTIHYQRGYNWQEVNIDFSDKNYLGNNLFEISFDGSQFRGYMLFDKFSVIFDDKLSSNFEYVPTVNNDNISVQFTNKAKGTFSSVFWDFGDRTNSTDINPTKIFAPGEYNVTLTVFNNDANDTYSQILSLIYPTIEGKMYASVQDAINDAVDGATIEIPNDITEDLNINQNLTLNFNGNNLNGNINVNNGVIVTVTNISDVFSVSTDDSSKLTITDSNINSNLELKAGNIDINAVSFNDSVLTIISANATLVNVNVVNGGVVVNGGKSKITNSNLTGSNLAISQTAGELEITNNIIKDNVKGIEITGGNATITFNAIYNNTNAFNATGATVTSTNNWYGTNTVTGINQYLRLVLEVDTAKMYSGDEYNITVDLTTDNNEASTIGAGALNDLTLQFTTTNGEVRLVTIHNGIGELKFKAGSVTDEVKLTLFGEEYALEDVSIVEKPLQTNITITSTEKGVITIVLKDSNGKNISNAIITYKINTENEVNKTTDANGIVSIPNLKGAISITVNYAGNDTYFPSNKENNFVFAYDTSISTTVAGNSIIITLKDDENKAIPNANVTYKINNAETTTATDANGTVTIPNLKGTIALTVTYKGSELYSTSNKTNNFVFPYTTTITAPSVSATYNVAKNLVITLKDENGKAVVGRTVNVKVGSISKNLVTNNNGQVSLNIAGLVPKTYTATISFEGDSLYTKSSINTVKVVVAKANPKITAKKATFKAKTKTKKYSITLKNNKGKAMSKVKVTLKVGKKTYKATTNSKGKATFKITKLTKKGKYTGTIKFAGNKYFKSASKKVKLTVKK